MSVNIALFCSSTWILLFLELKRADYVSIVLFTLCYVLDFSKLLRISGMCGKFLVR